LRKTGSVNTISAMRLTHFLTHNGLELFQLDKNKTIGNNLFHTSTEASLREISKFNY